MRKIFLVALVSCLASTQLGCIKSMLLNGQIEATRKASGAFDTIADYELARSAASAGLVQFEGMHRLAPDNDDALLMLTKGWVGYGYAFPEDAYEAESLADDTTRADYDKGRAQMAYDRAIFYGTELLAHKADGFADARKDLPGLKEWLAKNFDAPEDAETLFWVGYAWLARVNIAKEDPEQVAKLWVGVTILEHSLALDPSFMRYGASAALGAYHARSGMAELDESKRLFENAIEKTQRKALILLVNYASRYACMKNDKALYQKLLGEVVRAGDVDPNNRLQNMLAKRRAQRYLSKAWMLNECGFE
jgi:hypothetical protein